MQIDEKFLEIDQAVLVQEKRNVAVDIPIDDFLELSDLPGSGFREYDARIAAKGEILVKIRSDERADGFRDGIPCKRLSMKSFGF